MRIRRAFTLIELLVVISIIALLIAILLPALGRAREQGRAVVCMSNVKQVATAFFTYSIENGMIPGTYWQGPINLDWSGRMNAEYINNPGKYKHPLETSVLRKYLAEIDRILECPTSRREPNAIFDYTAIIRMAGARTDLPWEMTYPEDPTRRFETEHRFPALPILIEEHSRFYNAPYDDGSWANVDQITARHAGGANLGYLDGSASRFKTPHGAADEAEESLDLVSRDLRLLTKSGKFPVWRSNPSEFGWANQPR